jgi:hypothetical protein
MREITLKNSELVALVSDEDFEWLNQWVWHLSKCGYVVRQKSVPGKTASGRQKRKNVTMHRLVLTTIAPLTVDHINRNRLDNRRENLRPATRSQQIQNRSINKITHSGYKGVHWHSLKEKWQARIKVNGVRKSLGYYDTKEKAHEAYKNAAIKYFGDFACAG